MVDEAGKNPRTLRVNNLRLLASASLYRSRKFSILFCDRKGDMHVGSFFVVELSVSIALIWQTRLAVTLRSIFETECQLDFIW